MAIFFCAIPVGSALGYVVGGLVDKHWGWRNAFFVAGIPGLILAASCLLLRDPPRGAQDGEKPRAAADRQSAAGVIKATWATYVRLAKKQALRHHGARLHGVHLCHRRPWLLDAGDFLTSGCAAFRAIGKATVSFGTIVVITGFIGTFVGGWMGDFFAKRSKEAYLWVSAVATLIAAPLVWEALTAASYSVYTACMVAAQLCMFLSTGPINAAIVNLVVASKRATAIALECVRHSCAR